VNDTWLDTKNRWVYLKVSRGDTSLESSEVVEAYTSDTIGVPGEKVEGGDEFEEYIFPEELWKFDDLQAEPFSHCQHPT
jgi:hypothetical protein